MSQYKVKAVHGFWLQLGLFPHFILGQCILFRALYSEPEAVSSIKWANYSLFCVIQDPLFIIQKCKVLSFGVLLQSTYTIYLLLSM